MITSKMTFEEFDEMFNKLVKLQKQKHVYTVWCNRKFKDAFEVALAKEIKNRYSII